MEILHLHVCARFPSRGDTRGVARYSLTEDRSSAIDATIASSCCTARWTTMVAMPAAMQAATARAMPTRAKATVSGGEALGSGVICARRVFELLPDQRRPRAE